MILRHLAAVSDAKHLPVLDNYCSNLWVNPAVIRCYCFPCLFDGQTGELPIIRFSDLLLNGIGRPLLGNSGNAAPM